MRVPIRFPSPDRASASRGARFRSRCTPAAVAVGALLMGGSLPAVAQEGYNAPSKVEIAWNRLHDYDEITTLLNRLVAAYPELLKLESIGKSVEGRDLWLVTLNVAKTGAHAAKPAMYIDGNIHGNEVQAAEVVVYSIWYLTKSYGKVEQLTQLMDRCAFYFIPMVNPDGRAYWFASPNTGSSSRSGRKPLDNDADGLFDEDPPNDLDGDGRLLMMRREDPNGRMRESPEDNRLMVPVDPQQPGDYKRYSMLGMEGIDDDGDGLFNEDGPGGYDPNRNWPAAWQPDYVQFGAGDYPLSLPESKAIADFILAHPNIAGVQAYHNAAGMMLRGPGVASRESEYPPADLRAYDKIGKRGERIIPFYTYSVIYKDLYDVHGGFINWTAEELGIVSFTNELWTDRNLYGSKEGASQKEELEFSDYVMFGQLYVPWKKFRHPVYGEIELGGFVKMTGRVPPSFHLEEECHRNFAFTVYHAHQMPLVELANLEVASLGGGLSRVRVDVCNRRAIATTTAQAARRRYGPRDRIEVTGGGLKVIAGGTIENRFTAPMSFVEHRPERIWIDDGIPGEGFRTYEWVVSGQGEGVIRFSGPRSGVREATFRIGG